MSAAAFEGLLLLAAFLCSLVAGFLFAFAAVVMPGLSHLDDTGFIRAFQVVDGVIQRNQPLFLAVWIGSVLALVAAFAVGMAVVSGTDRLLMILAAIAYVFGVQLPTVAINIPLNNTLQRADPGAMDAAMLRRVRQEFEPRWNRWNAMRTAAAGLASILLLLLLIRMGAPDS